MRKIVIKQKRRGKQKRIMLLLKKRCSQGWQQFQQFHQPPPPVQNHTSTLSTTSTPTTNKITMTVPPPPSEVEGTCALYDWAIVCQAHPMSLHLIVLLTPLMRLPRMPFLVSWRWWVCMPFLWDFLQVHHPDPITSLYLYGKDGVLVEDFVYPPSGVDIKAVLRMRVQPQVQRIIYTVIKR